MRKLVPIKELTKACQYKRLISLSLELMFFLLGVASAIFMFVTGDPHNRLASCFGIMAAYLAPITVELIFRKRLNCVIHILYSFYMFFTLFLGSVFGLHNAFGPMDEIGHTLFGYFASLSIFIIFIKAKNIQNMKPIAIALITFLISMGAAAIWECAEFTVDIFLGQNSLGYPPAAIEELIKANNLKGIAAAIESLRHVSVIDTVTDLILHIVGSSVFFGHYMLHRKLNKNLLLGSLTKTMIADEMNKTATEIVAAKNKLSSTTLNEAVVETTARTSSENSDEIITSDTKIPSPTAVTTDKTDNNPTTPHDDIV